MSENHREHIRLNLDCTVFVEVNAGPALDGNPGEVALCKSLDVSYGGLKVSLARELKVGSILPVAVELPAVATTFHLVGEVKWCRPDSDQASGWAAGIQLLNSDDSDIDGWRDLLLHV